jgi:hypothetical protein
MSIASGLKKLFMRKERFAPPNEYKLNKKEKESIIVFFSILGCIVIISILFYIIY